jgi:hypothetical protein
VDLEDASSRAKFMIRDRDGKFPHLFDAILADASSRHPRLGGILNEYHPAA